MPRKSLRLRGLVFLESHLEAKTLESSIDAGVVAADQALAANPGLARAHLTRAGLLVLRAGLLSGARRLALAAEPEAVIWRAVDLNPRLASEVEPLRRQAVSLRSLRP